MTPDHPEHADDRTYQRTIEGTEPDEQKDRDRLRRERDEWRNLFTQLVEEFPEPILAVDDERVLRHFNGAAEEQYGRSQAEAIGTTGYEFFGTEGKSEILAETVARTGEAVREEEYRKVPTPDGDMWVRAIAVPMETLDGEVIGSVEMTPVVTDLVRQRERMTAAQRTVSEEVRAALQRLRGSAESVADSSARSAAIANDQHGSMEAVVGDVADLSASIEEIAATAREVETTSARAEELALDGRSAAREAIDAMESVDAAGDEMASDVTALRERIAEINGIVEVIDGVAEQTNMLALNASIEAARAGAAGEGFAVVAEEIKDLANESREQAGEIEATVDDVQETTARTVDGIRETNEELSAGIERAEAVTEALSDIVEAVSRTAEGIADVARVTDDQATGTEQVATTVEEVATRAQELATEIDTIVDANREQSRLVEGIDESIGSLERELSAVSSDG
ncbi:methyl-accepting chemotaxis protein [Halobaculum litoreum]|uniref:methyl-accepting chemotaxis protein n=2 Tax=Halobaculum litoreum TaxID=3031998 RepID=UPI0024C40AFC|nr:methyl-accepting chemotaxis protein [Halobaculum sp. DT92]